MIDLPAEFNLGFHLIALGNCHIVHVVTHAADTDVRGFHDADGRTHPAADPLLHLRIVPVAEDQLSLNPHTTLDMAVLPVAVRRLIFIHEIHVDGTVGNLFIKLSQQMAQRFFVFLQTDDPHLCRRKRVHPGDDAGALRIVVGVVKGLADGCLADQGRL